MRGKGLYLSLCCLIGLILAGATTVVAQKKEKSTGLSLADRKARINQHSIFLELGGSGVYYTLNYETLFLNRGGVRWYGRLGFEWIPQKPVDKTIHFPIITSVTFLKSRWQPEIGFGALFRMNFDEDAYDTDGQWDGYFGNNPPTQIFLTPSIGVRWISKPNDHNETWLVKIAFTPILGLDVYTEPTNSLISSSGNPYFFPWAGVSFGRSWSNRNRKK